MGIAEEKYGEAKKKSVSFPGVIPSPSAIFE